MKKMIILVGGGGHSHACIDVIEQSNEFEVLGVIDRTEMIGQRVLGYDVIGTDDQIPNFLSKCKNFLITVGQVESVVVRRQIYERLCSLKADLPTIISPRAYVSKHAIVGRGTIVMHGAIINAGASVGANCIINSQSLIEHDSRIGDHCHISTGAIINGGTTVGEGTFFWE